MENMKILMIKADECYFLRYEDNSVGGVCNMTNKIFGMMPHPERNNQDFKSMFFKCYFTKSNY